MNKNKTSHTNEIYTIAIISLIMLVTILAVKTQADSYISSTAEFNTGIHNNTATETDIMSMQNGSLFMELDGVNDTEISQIVAGRVTGLGNQTGTEYSRGQCININADTIITQIGFNISFIIGTPANISVTLWDVPGAAPVNKYAQSNIKEHGDITLNMTTWFNFSKPIKLNDSVQYALMLETGANSTTGHYYAVYAEDSNVYGAGKLRYASDPHGSITWLSLATWDMWFILNSQDFKAEANWTTEALTIPAGQRLKETYINHTVSASQNISRIEWYQGGVEVASYATPITTGTETTLTDGSVTGSLTGITAGTFNIKIFFESNSTFTPIINNITAIYETIPAADTSLSEDIIETVNNDVPGLIGLIFLAIIVIAVASIITILFSLMKRR